MAARAIEDHFEYQHQFAARWNPQGEVDLSQGDGSSLMSSDAMVMGSDIASRAHADTSTLHAEHGGKLELLLWYFGGFRSSYMTNRATESFNIRTLAIRHHTCDLQLLQF